MTCAASCTELHGRGCLIWDRIQLIYVRVCRLSALLGLFVASPPRNYCFTLQLLQAFGSRNHAGV